MFKVGPDGSKGKLVGNRQEENSQLTADTTLNYAGWLDAEYILDGRRIKLTTGDAIKAAAAVANDFVSLHRRSRRYSVVHRIIPLQLTWAPSADMKDPQVDMAGSACNPWKITEPRTGDAAGTIYWALQVTAPLPLEAIQDLFAKAVGNQGSALLPGIAPSRNMVHVTKDFFQANPNGI